MIFFSCLQLGKLFYYAFAMFYKLNYGKPLTSKSFQNDCNKHKSVE